MKRFLSMMMFVTLSFAAIGPINSYAISSDVISGAGFGKLSEVEQVEVLKMVAEKSQAQRNGTNIINTSTNPEMVNKWVEVGANVGKGLAGAAKELGVEVNNFATTPVGQLTIWLIVWHMMGNVIIHFIGGFIVWIVGFIGIWFIRNKILISNESLSTDARGTLGTMVVVVVIAGIVTMFTFGRY